MKYKCLLLSIILTAPLVAAGSPLSSHIAYYKVTLEKAAKDNPIKNINGVMVFKLNNVCDGWTIEQKSSSTADIKDRDEKSQQSINSQYIVWESNKGHKFDFRTHKEQNGEKSSTVGNAETSDNKTIINFKEPNQLGMSTDAKITYPIQLLESQIQAMNNGTKTIDSLVFDGSSFGEPVLIKTDVGSIAEKCVVIDNNKNEHAIDVYPLKMTVYAADSDGKTPNFIISQRMSKNGIMCSYRVVFPTHVIYGELVDIKYTDATNICK